MISLPPLPGLQNLVYYSRLDRPRPQGSTVHEALGVELDKAGNAFGTETQYGEPTAKKLRNKHSLISCECFSSDNGCDCKVLTVGKTCEQDCSKLLSFYRGIPSELLPAGDEAGGEPEEVPGEGAGRVHHPAPRLP